MKDCIVVNPQTCHGKPTIKGTRIMVSNVLSLLAGGWTLVTYDLDFSRRFMASKDLPGLILLRVHPHADQPLVEGSLEESIG